MKAIIVGTSASILEKENGLLIDAFDYVARSVSSAPYYGYEKYTGIKTDMFWSKFQFLYRLQFLRIPFVGKLLLLNSNPDSYYEGYIPENIQSTRYKRYMFDLWYEEFTKKHTLTELIYQDLTFISNLHKSAGFKQQNVYNTDTPVYSSAGLRVIDYFIQTKMFNKIYVTGFSFFDKGTYFDRAHNHVVHEHCFYKERIYYNHLIKEKKIYEL